MICWVALRLTQPTLLSRAMEPTVILSTGPKLKTNFAPAPASLAAHPPPLDYQINMHAIHWTRPSNN
jgi:hypothetical protein